LTLTLKPHQEIAVDFWQRNNGRGLNSSDPGLGKTAASIVYFERNDVWPVLIVCPVAVVGHWQKEIAAWTGRKALVVQGRALYEGTIEEPATIIPYSVLADQLPFLLEQQFNCITFDEAHSLQNPDAKWTRAALALARRCPRVQGLSGTPVANRVKDFWPILHTIRPDLFPSFNQYAWSYCAPTFIQAQGRWDYTGSNNLEELHEIIKPFTLRHRKDILNLPPQTIRMQTVEIDNRDTYQGLQNQYMQSAKSVFSRFGNQGADKLSLTTQMLMTTARGKSRAVVQWLRDALEEDPARKIIVFCTHTGMLDVIHRRVAPGRSLMINGSVSGKKRTAIVAQFETDPEISLIVCNIVAAGSGITLNAATLTVFAELPWAPRHILQAKDRNYRIGQLNATEVVYLVAEKTIEEKLCRVLQEKANIADAIVDGKKQNQMNVLAMLQKAMLER